MKNKTKPLCSCKPERLLFRCETCKILHAMFCRDPHCRAGICRAVRAYHRAERAVQVVTPAESAANLRHALRCGRLWEAVEGICPGCDTRFYASLREQMARERGP